jgi:hypothetical protein
MSTAWQPAPNAPIVEVAHPALKRALLRDEFEHATLEEYARASGADVDVVMEALSPALDAGSVALETAGGEVFLLTAPTGRPMPRGVPDLAPNLWELLRSGRNVEEAWSLWRLVRGMERSGWEVTARTTQIHQGLVGFPTHPVPLGVVIGGRCAPVVVGASPDQLADASGPLGEYERLGARAIAVVCAQSALDECVTAVRRFALGWRMASAPLTVLILEAPRYQPVMLQATDSSIRPVSVTQSTLTSLVWGLE